MMIAYENDVFTIPEELKKMSVSEIEQKKQKLLSELKKHKPEKRPTKSNENGIIYKF